MQLRVLSTAALRLSSISSPLAFAPLVKPNIYPSSLILLKMTSTSTAEATDNSYVPPKVWKPKDDMGGKFGSINRPTAGARFDKELPRGKHPLQLYSMGTPNGQKVTIMLEELLDAGHQGAEYDAFYINIMEGDQFGSGFVEINPNSKIPALLDTTTGVKMFESGSILLQLSEKFNHAFCPPAQRAQVLNWLFWQMGSAPYLGGGFGHFYCYAPSKMQYPIDRFTMEAKRQLDVLEKHLAATQTKYMVGDDFTLADIAIFPWYGLLVLGELYEGSVTFLNVEEDFPHVIRWAKDVASRPAVERGTKVNRSAFVLERHDASDFDKLVNGNKRAHENDHDNNESATKQSKL